MEDGCGTRHAAAVFEVMVRCSFYYQDPADVEFARLIGQLFNGLVFDCDTRCPLYTSARLGSMRQCTDTFPCCLVEGGGGVRWQFLGVPAASPCWRRQLQRQPSARTLSAATKVTYLKKCPSKKSVRQLFTRRCGYYVSNACPWSLRRSWCGDM